MRRTLASLSRRMFGGLLRSYKPERHYLRGRPSGLMGAGRDGGGRAGRAAGGTKAPPAPKGAPR